jgi:hypothetical protein
VANVLIADLPAATTLAGTEAVEIDDGVNSKKVTVFQLAALAWPTARTLTVASAGQTAFTLPTAPANAAGLMLLVNGGSYAGPANVTVTGTTLTWVNPSFGLTPSDQVIALYS